MGEQTESKIKEMPLQERLKYGYGRILRMLHISGGISIVAMLLLYFGGTSRIFGNGSGIVATFFLVVGLVHIILFGIVSTRSSQKSLRPFTVSVNGVSEGN